MGRIAYGMESIELDGNNILEVYHTIQSLAAELRENPRPILIECKTYRMRGHEEASGVKYVPKEDLELWATKDPLINFENFLLEEGVMTSDDVANIRQEIAEEIAHSWESKPVRLLHSRSITYRSGPAGRFLLSRGP